LADLRGFAPNRRAAPDFAPNLERLKSTRDAAGPLGLTLVPAEARGLDALEQAFATMIGERVQALTVLSDGVLFNRKRFAHALVRSMTGGCKADFGPTG